jgi:hypothetical protein
MPDFSWGEQQKVVDGLIDTLIAGLRPERERPRARVATRVQGSGIKRPKERNPAPGSSRGLPGPPDPPS